MPVIELQTIIKAPLHICFDLSCSIDLHQITASRTKEKAVAGVTSGLIGLNQTVTWQAVHFGITQTLTSRITQFDRPFHFRDVQVRGAFKYLVHDHIFIEQNGEVLMKDRFEFEAPFGIAGKLVSRLVLKNYLNKFLRERNSIIKSYAEDGSWRSVLP